MKLVPENINEAIKHLKPRSEEEIEKLLPKDIKEFQKFLADNNIKYKIRHGEEHNTYDYVVTFETVKGMYQLRFTVYEKRNRNKYELRKVLGPGITSLDYELNDLDTMIRYIRYNIIVEPFKRVK